MMSFQNAAGSFQWPWGTQTAVTDISPADGVKLAALQGTKEAGKTDCSNGLTLFFFLKR